MDKYSISKTVNIDYTIFSPFLKMNFLKINFNKIKYNNRFKLFFAPRSLNLPTVFNKNVSP